MTHQGGLADLSATAAAADPLKSGNMYFLAIFIKNRFFDMFEASWGPGVVDRLGILQNPGGVNFSSRARSWSGFVSIGQVVQKSTPQEMCFSREIIDVHKTRFRSILWGGKPI